MNLIQIQSRKWYKAGNGRRYLLKIEVAQVITGGDAGIGRSVCYHSALEAATLAFTYVKGQENRDKDDTLQMLQEEKTCEAKDALAIAAHIRTVGGLLKLL
ncbi:hypothetical protein QUC31_016709 [Theobroma cacao]